MHQIVKRNICLFLCSILLLFSAMTGINVEKSMAKETLTIRIVIDGTVYRYISAKKDSSKQDWYVDSSVIQKTLGMKPVGVSDGYASLRKSCQKKDVSFEYDDIMAAAYIWTDVPYSSFYDDEIFRAYRLGFVTKKDMHSLNKQISTNAYRSMLLKMIKHADVKEAQNTFMKNVRAYNKKMLRGEAFIMTFYAALAIGADTFRSNDDDKTWKDLEKMWKKKSYWNFSGCAFNKLFPNINKKGKPYPEVGVKDAWDFRNLGYFWASCQSSLKTDRHIFTWTKNLSMRPTEKLTVKDAVFAVVRLFDSIPVGKKYDKMVSVNSSSATQVDHKVFTSAVSKKMKKLPQITSENMPQWKGPFVLDGWFASETRILHSELDIHNLANWGFNAIRYNLSYETFFNKDGTKVNLSNLKKLDELIAAAVRYGMHFELLLDTLPGRTVWSDDEWNTKGSLDLFVNTKRQKEAAQVWSTLAKRYKNVPNATLTFVPLWEPTNVSLASGLPAPDYNDTDVFNTISLLVKAIRKQDSKRLIIIESTSDNDEKDVVPYAEQFRDTYLTGLDNIVFSANYCQKSYCFAEMTDVEGASMDLHNHGLFKPEYPLCNYAAQKNINPDNPVSLSGCLPSGTNIEIYLEKVDGNGMFDISADGVSLYSENLSSKKYEIGEHLSFHYPFAESEKKITLKLESDINELLMSFTGDNLEWSGINVNLPKQYAVKRWYYEGFYDAYLDGRGTDEIHPPKRVATSTVMLCPNTYNSGNRIVIHDDVTYTSEAIFEEANKAVADSWTTAIASCVPKAQIRLEPVSFSVGTSQASAERYYSDSLGALNSQSFGWYISSLLSNLVVYDKEKDILAGGRAISYKQYRLFNPELLKKIQEFQ